METYSRPTGLPLILAALPEHHHLFHAVSHNPCLLSEGIKTHPDAISLDELWCYECHGKGRPVQSAASGWRLVKTAAADDVARCGLWGDDGDGHRARSAPQGRREQFDVGIGYDDSINDAQEIALQVLIDHPAVLSDPEPLVLAESLGKATVNLRVFFWINGRTHSWLKVRSSLIRQVKRAFQTHGISMPDEAREVVFPQGIPITMADGKLPSILAPQPQKQVPAAGPPSEEPDIVSTKAEGGLQSEADVLDEEARQAQPLREAENLLPQAPVKTAL